jgi:hypothetical protein
MGQAQWDVAPGIASDAEGTRLGATFCLPPDSWRDFYLNSNFKMFVMI